MRRARLVFRLPQMIRAFVLLPALAAAVVSLPETGRAAEPQSLSIVVSQYCIGCHDADSPKGDLNLAGVVAHDLARHPATWEKVVRKLRSRQMPPAGRKRPDEAAYESVIAELELSLDRAAKLTPNPGRTDTIRRLTRTEYQNAIRDLLSLDIDASTLLPADEAGHGFDNVTVGELSPTLLDRYISAAQKIAPLAVGSTRRSPGGDTFRVRPDITQEDRIEGLPIGTRGGTLIRYTFPVSGEYEVQVRLARDRNEHVEGLTESHELEILVDRERARSFTVKPPPGRQDFQHVDAHLRLKLTVSAGPHDIGVTFVKNPTALIETARQPSVARFNMHRHPRTAPAVYQVTITGPFTNAGPGESPSRRRLFIVHPKSTGDEEPAARQILATVLRRAYRRPVSAGDVDRVMPFFHEARREGNFDSGIEAALSAVLVSREFLFRVEQPPPGTPMRTTYRISNLDLASRLAFFLWSSIPDDELLSVAERGELQKPEVLAAQTRRMLADPRAASLVTGFASQWLHIRNLDSITPDARLFPDFDDNLRQAMRRETELLFEETMRADRSVLDLLHTEHTWLNERLAKHYGIPHIYGPQFRKVALANSSQRGGLLRHGSVLTVTSYATRTSPVIRGKWVLENLLGTPPPPPPPDVPTLDDNSVSASLPVRERLAKHRANAACASCHNLIDPTGFSLENYDAIGRWRTTEEGQPVDAAGGLPDGSRFDGVGGLEQALLRRPDVFVSTLTEKLFTFALGRGVESHDAPYVREVVRAAKAADYRFSAVIGGIVASVPFQMRTSP